jgi:hypothetical protein
MSITAPTPRTRTIITATSAAPTRMTAMVGDRRRGTTSGATGGACGAPGTGPAGAATGAAAGGAATSDAPHFWQYRLPAGVSA